MEDFEDVKDYADFEYFREIMNKVLMCFDVEKKHFRFNPFNVGFMEAENDNPKLYQTIVYLLNKLLAGV